MWAVLMETLERRSVGEAITGLGIARTRFFVLKRRALQAMLESLEPGAPGRPGRHACLDTARVAELGEELHELRVDLEKAQIRIEAGRLIPEVLLEPVSRGRRARKSAAAAPAVSTPPGGGG